MPLEVKVPKEITEYREKIMFGLSIRQLICVIVAAIVCIVTYFAIRPFIGNDLAGYFVLGEAMPIMGVGFLRINGFTFEKYVMLVLKHEFSQQVRVYKTELSVDFFDYYSDFGLGVNTCEELVSKAKKEKYARVGGEAASSKDVAKSEQGDERELKGNKGKVQKVK